LEELPLPKTFVNELGEGPLVEKEKSTNRGGRNTAERGTGGVRGAPPAVFTKKG